MSTSLQNRIKTLREIIKRKGSFFFVGILGISMSALSEYLFGLGCRVAGADISDRASSRLFSLGISVKKRGDRETISGFDAMIVTHAIPSDATEFTIARDVGVPTYTRAELLGAIMLSWRHRIGVSGSHGKSTTTAMLHTIFSSLGRSPTTFSGAPLSQFDAASYALGEGETFIYEACEYKDSFLAFSPTVALITSIELDHTDYFRSEEEILYSFYLSTKGAECVIINRDYPLCRHLLTMLGDKRVITVGSASAGYVYSAADARGGVEYRIDHEGKAYEGRLAIHGDYNACNAALAIAAAKEQGIAPQDALRALGDFRGTPGRLEEIGRLGERSVILDYAHHPTEIRLSISSLISRLKAPTIVFRPHTYTRTRDLFSGFVDALSLAPHLIITDTYAAREEPIPGASAFDLCAAVPGASYVPYENLLEYLARENSLDPIVLMGAGDFSLVKEKIKG